METKTIIKLVIALAVLVAVGIGAWQVTNRMSERTLTLLVGGGTVLGIVLVVGILFIAKDVVQSYLMQRMIAQDDMNDLKQMAALKQLMGDGKSNINVKMPQQEQIPQWAILPQGQLPQRRNDQQGQVFDGSYRDTTVELE